MSSNNFRPSPGLRRSRHVARNTSSSKSALNSIAVSYANELRDTPNKVNAADPGYCRTDPNDGAPVAIHLAILPDDGPTGAFIGADGTKPW